MSLISSGFQRGCREMKTVRYVDMASVNGHYVLETARQVVGSHSGCRLALKATVRWSSVRIYG